MCVDAGLGFTNNSSSYSPGFVVKLVMDTHVDAALARVELANNGLSNFAANRSVDCLSLVLQLGIVNNSADDERVEAAGGLSNVETGFLRSVRRRHMLSGTSPS